MDWPFYKIQAAYIIFKNFYKLNVLCKISMNLKNTINNINFNILNQSESDYSSSSWG